MFAVHPKEAEATAPPPNYDDVPNKKLDLDTLERGTDSSHSSQAVDPWAIADLVDNSPKWSELTTSGKVKRVVVNVAKVVTGLGLLYLFVCSLDFLSSSFRLIAGKATGDIFQGPFLGNPVVGLMIGILVTVLVQSSSTSTSIVVSMVGANILEVPQAIPIIMGANVGTSVTNTLVSFTQMGNRNEFRRAFAAATVHDMFNWLTVITLFIVEEVLRGTVGQGYLEYVSYEVTKGLAGASASEIKLLTVITDPFTQLVIQLNKTVLDEWALGNENFDNASLVKINCAAKPKTDFEDCHFLFANTSMNDLAIGLILLAISLVLLCGCLVGLVKILNSAMKGSMANVIKKVINADIPYVPWLTGYLAILVGAGMTFLVQSSSVFTSALTPLVGVGVITIERVYPLTLGSNIGTTTTALIAALATTGARFQNTLQISLCHLLFNVTGILLFYPIPFMRFPIAMAKSLGETTAKYRWFAIAYLVGMFLLLPAFVMGVSFGGDAAIIGVMVPIGIIIVAVVVITVLQRKYPKILPKFLHTWKFLPLWMRSLEPMDRLISNVNCCKACCKCCRDESLEQESTSETALATVTTGSEKAKGIDNPSFS